MVRVSSLRAATARRPAPVPCDIKFKLKKIHRFYIFREDFTLNCGESSGGFTNSEQKKATKSCACTMRRSVEKMSHIPDMVFVFALHTSWCRFINKFTNSERLMVFKISIYSR